MNVGPVKTIETLRSFKRIPSMASTDFNEKSGHPQEVGDWNRWTESTQGEGIKVLIVSGNSFVTDFLRGLVEAHGYETEEAQAFRETLVQESKIRPHVAFIDDSCLEMKDIKNFQLKTLQLTQAGVLTVLLASEQTKQVIEQLPTMKFFQILEKPVDYIQIGQIMADFVNA